MIKIIFSNIKIILAVGIISTVAVVYSINKGFKDQLLDYIDTNSISDETELKDPDSSKEKKFSSNTRPYKSAFFHKNSKIYSTMDYRPGDWNKYIIDSEYSKYMQSDKLLMYGNEDVKIHSYGAIKMNMIYGGSMYTDDKYKQFDEDKPVSSLVKPGFTPEQEMQLHMEGTIGNRLTIYIDHDSRKKNNRYLMQYRAIEEDEVIREINAGEIDIKFNHSKYAVYEESTQKALGVDITLRKNKFQLKAFGSVTRGETEVEFFKGNSSPGNFRLSEYQYIKRKYYQLEPFIRYDNRTTLPTDYNQVTFTSSPADPDNYYLYPVNIEPSGFELYMDDQNPYNNYNAITLSIDSGEYTKLASGQDYTINYVTGFINFKINIPENARIFAVYNLKSGSTVDPGALSPGDGGHPGGSFTGKIFVFIKYGYSIDEDTDKDLVLDTGEDTNNDGKLNLDIYEKRSAYYVGDRYILQDDFLIQFINENKIMTKTDINNTGNYSVDYLNGIINFTYREPFKRLLTDNYSSSAASNVYAEKQNSNVYLDSHYNIKIDYFKDARSFQLKHFNIIPGSVIIKINRRKISNNMFSIDYTSGFLIFTNPSNPLIGPETEIEIRYEYLPFAGQSQTFVGGIRADYRVNRNLNLGGSFLFTRSASSEVIPKIENNPTQTMLIEGDATVRLDSRRLADFANFFPGKKRKSVPFEINAYGEYAKSYKNINTFGKGLIDNMESSNEIITISTSEKDWILSSMPSAYVQNDRGLLNYWFYRDPSSPTTLEGPSYSATEISYSVKPGPYNIAAGHIADSIREESSQRSLVLDFDFSGGTNVSIATRRLSNEAVDFSGLQYIEIWYKYDGSTSVDLSVDIGKLDEDSDGDGILDTEDINNNGYLDTDPNNGYSEDEGYQFDGNNLTVVGSGPRLNSNTSGDGILNSEDLNGNGYLETTENVYSISAFALAANDPQWKKERIYIDYTSLSQAEIETLKQTESVRINVSNGSGATGKIYISSIKFVSSKYRNIEFNGSATGPTDLSVTMINSINDTDYRSNSLLFSEENLYTSLYGSMTDDELSKESETALQLNYSFPGAGNLSVTRTFSKSMDLRFYKTMNFWFNVRSYSGSETIGIRLGSSENDYVEYEFPISFANVWREIRLKLSTGSNGDVDVKSSSGNIDMKRIKYFKIFIYGSAGNTGEIWVNEIYVSEPETLESSAYWYEGELKVKRPVFKTKAGTPILSDINIKYIEKGHGANFSTIGKKISDVREKYRQIFSSMKILPNWYTKVDYIEEKSKTDSLNEDVVETKRGTTEKNTLFFVSDYISNKNAVPSIKVTYKIDNFANRKDQYLTNYLVNSEIEESVHTPVITIVEEVDGFLWGKLKSKLYLDMLFKNSKIDRSSTDIDQSSLSSIIPVYEKEKRQKSTANLSIDYRNSIFYIKPEFSIESEEIVELYGKSDLNSTEVRSDVQGDYHFPFIYNDKFKFVERNKRFVFAIGLNGSNFITPEYKIDFSYLENKFSDYSDYELSLTDSFTRSRDARSFIMTQINIPVRLNKFKSLNFVKSFNISFMRSLYYLENNVPFEGETHDSFNEEYGIENSLFSHMDIGTNFFKYYPGYFFTGRDNFAGGRDYAYNNDNGRLVYKSGSTVTDYNNQLRLINNFTLNFTMDFKIFSIDTNTGLNQVNERQNINGTPQQVVSANIGTRINFDLMKIFNFGFFRPNAPGKPYHGANFNIGYNYSNNMIITSNIEENRHSPNFGITFKWDRSHLGFSTGLEYRKKNDKEYISTTDSERSADDDIYIDNMPQTVSFKEEDYSYNFSVIYETDVKWIFNYLSSFYKLAAFPIFTVEYSMILNRYDYTSTVSPEPYDLYLIKGKLTLDLHKNIQGGITSMWALERFRNRETEGISREILSYEVGVNLSLIF